MANALDSTVFFKPTGTVQIANRFTLVERRLLNCLIWHAQKSRMDGNEKEIRVREVLNLIGHENSRNVDNLKSALKTLIGTVIEWNIFGADKVHIWGACTFLQSGKIIGGASGKLKYRLNEEIIEQITQPMLFAKIQLLVQSQVRKRYALVLYEYFLDVLGRNHRDAIKVGIELDKLYRLLGLTIEDPAKQIEFKVFSRDILKPSLVEICKQTDLDVNHETVRASRKISSIIFIINKKATFQLHFGFDSAEAALHSDHGHGEPDPKLVQLLVEQGIADRKARELAAKYDAERIKGNVKHVVDEIAAGKTIRNPQAFLVKAIEEDYRPKLMVAASRARTKSAGGNEGRPNKEESLQREWKGFWKSRLEEKLAALLPDDLSALQGRFVEHMQNDNPMAYKVYLRSGFNSKMVSALFSIWAKHYMLTAPEEIDFDSFRAMKAAT